ncbi:MAG: hypothetical protein CVU91_12270 [Firmicutes bacterium HGW-Firmicutes-16]|nr:MAG: hypothetical protein CVU91_12270 [Firmicutes bacterium HGW-Firmicutes-16]
MGAPTTLNISLFESSEEVASTQLMDVVQLLETPISDINLYAAYLAAGDAIESPPISEIENDVANKMFRSSNVDDMIFRSTVTVLSER